MSAALVFAFAVLGNVVAADAGNVLVNGDFRQGVLRGSWSALYSGSHAIPGWQVLAPVDYVSSAYWQTAASSRSIDLDGTPGPGAIAQTFHTIPGNTYWLRFDLAANTEGPPRVKRVRVTVGDGTHTLAIDGSGRSNAAMRYEHESLTFVARATSTTLEFASLSGPGNWNGAVLTDVAVSDITDRLRGEAAHVSPVRTPSFACETAFE